MRVNVAGVELRSPVIAASGTFGYGIEFEEIVSLDTHRRVRDEGAVAGADGGQCRTADY